MRVIAPLGGEINQLRVEPLPVVFWRLVALLKLFQTPCHSFHLVTTLPDMAAGWARLGCFRPEEPAGRALGLRFLQFGRFFLGSLYFPVQAAHPVAVKLVPVVPEPEVVARVAVVD